MRKVTSIICSILFFMSGIMMAFIPSDPSPGTGYKTIAASTIMPNTFPVAALDTGIIDIPEDIVRDLAKRKGVLDTVYVTKTDTIKEQVTKVKWRQAPAPDPIVVRDTIREAHYYLATQVGNKEGPTDKCISVYEVHEVDKICPETTNSSVELMNESDGGVVE
jgi:hypothetical protein